MPKGSSNKNLHKASQAKKDEFYTQLVDIEKELKHYKDQFRGKVVYCNCDDPYESNFFKFFAANFNAYKLKKLITTSYSGSPIIGGQLSLLDMPGSKGKQPIKIEINKVPANKDGSVGLADVQKLLKHDANVSAPLKGSGDFRSDECIKLLKEADIVVTNPPFSLFREYVAQLVEYKKKFLILGDQNAITYKEIFKLIQENKLWLGCENGGTKWFQVPMDYDIPTESRKKIVNGIKYFSMGRIMWYTNLDSPKRHQELILYKKYSAKEYPKYENYDAIEVSKYIDIPSDYNEVMGVPITFIDKYNPEQFEIIGMAKRGAGDPALKSKVYTVADAKNYSDLNAGPVLKTPVGLKNTFPRILIKNKKVKK